MADKFSPPQLPVLDLVGVAHNRDAYYRRYPIMYFINPDDLFYGDEIAQVNDRPWGWTANFNTNHVTWGVIALLGDNREYFFLCSDEGEAKRLKTSFMGCFHAYVVAQQYYP